MKQIALIVLVAIAAACGVQPDPNDHASRVDQVQPAPFHSQHGMEFHVVDDGSSYMRQLFDDVPIDRPVGITAQTDRWTGASGLPIDDVYLVGPSPAAIERYLASQPALAVPHDRRLVFERIDASRWRTYLVFPTTELDASSIAHAETGTDPNTGRPIVTLDFTPDAARHFGELTARIVGHKLAVLVDGTVISAPIIRTEIRGGRASVSFGSEGDANGLAGWLDARDPR